MSEHERAATQRPDTFMPLPLPLPRASRESRNILHRGTHHYIFTVDIRLDAAGLVAEQPKRKRHPRR
jgi:hypothetical protein